MSNAYNAIPWGRDPEIKNLNDGTHARVFSPNPGVMGQHVGWRDFDIIGGSLEAGAKINFSIPLCKTLIDHYCHGNGVELGLTEGGMIQCNALIDIGDSKRSAQFLRFVNQMGAEIAKNARNDSSQLKELIVESDVSFSLLGSCNTSGTLGNFTVNVSGKLKVWNPDANGNDADWSFNGHMWWYDFWDFDKKAPPGKGELGRTKRGEWRTYIASWLVGAPFDIKTAAVSVSQVRAEANGINHYAKWIGNPDGKFLPVVSGML